jgi:hypothetical protein
MHHDGESPSEEPARSGCVPECALRKQIASALGHAVALPVELDEPVLDEACHLLEEMMVETAAENWSAAHRANRRDPRGPSPAPPAAPAASRDRGDRQAEEWRNANALPMSIA